MPAHFHTFMEKIKFRKVMGLLDQAKAATKTLLTGFVL